jgi:cytoskeletal protein CcmA (bactofilin family)
MLRVILSNKMASDNRRRLLDQLTGSPTFVANHCRLTGDFEADGPVTMCGIVRGDGRVGGPLNMPVGAEWHGEVHAKQAVINGTVVGRLVIDGKLEIGLTAVIRADVVAKTLAIAKGAIIEGAIEITSGQPVINFIERRHKT